LENSKPGGGEIVTLGTFSLGGGNSNIFKVHPYLWKIPILTDDFSDGLVQPPTISSLLYKRSSEHQQHSLGIPSTQQFHFSFHAGVDEMGVKVGRGWNSSSNRHEDLLDESRVPILIDLAKAF